MAEQELQHLQGGRHNEVYFLGHMLNILYAEYKYLTDAYQVLNSRQTGGRNLVRTRQIKYWRTAKDSSLRHKG